MTIEGVKDFFFIFYVIFSIEGVTVCDQVERQICAEDNCALVEGEEEVRRYIISAMERRYGCEQNCRG